MVSIRGILTVALLIAALALHLHGLLPYLPRTDNDFDAVYHYLPDAKRLLHEGFSFFLEEESIAAPPFAYIYPALIGPTLATVKNANVVLSCVLMLFVYRTGVLWQSRLAGLCAALVYAATPLLKPYLATAVTEPPYLFLAGLWIWALSEWVVRGRPVYVAMAGIALSLALLTRASIFYGVVILTAVLVWRAYRAAPAIAREARGSALVHLIALVPALAFIVKNLAVFGFAFYTTGAGNALYLGSNPATGGYDPNYLGLIYDSGMIARDQSHLSLEAERLLGGVARMVLASLDPAFVAAMYAKKVAAFLFVTNAETIGDIVTLRAWRIATLILAAIGIFGIRVRWLRALAAGIVLYQVASHIPVLYTHRYSVGALDLWLALLSGIGIATLWQRRRRAAEGAIVAAAILAGALAGGYAYWNGTFPEPDAWVAAHDIVWDRSAEALEAASVQGFVAQDGAWRFGQRLATLEFEVHDAPRFHPLFNYALVIDSTLTPAASDEACGVVRIAYKREGESDFSDAHEITRKLIADGKPHEDQFGASIPLHLQGEGRLRLAFECAPGGRLELRRLAVVALLGALDYHDRYFAQHPELVHPR
ncbi:MAG: ArnT family glycosyltransferase [Bacillota bacterium]